MVSPGTEAVRIISEFEGKRLQRILSWWQDIRKTGAFPSRADFRLTEWKAHLPWIAVVDLIRGPDGVPSDGQIKVWGTGLSAPFGGDVTGQKLSDFGEPYVSRWTHPALIVHKTLAPAAVSGRVLLAHKDYQRFEMVFLPLFDDAGVYDRLMIETELLE